MKLLKLGIRFWITVSSLFSFLVGWILLAHAATPDQSHAPGSGSHSLAPLPSLEPLTPLFQFQPGDDDPVRQQPFFSVQSPNRSRPFFTTGGS